MSAPTIGTALLGGALIGLAAALLLLLTGRIAGISGIVGGLLPPAAQDAAWRAVFVLGLVLGPLVVGGLGGPGLRVRHVASLPVLVVAGLLVGVGTRLGSGCTSGHGVCGLARRSQRSLVATGIFMGAGMLTATLVHHLGGGRP